MNKLVTALILCSFLGIGKSSYGEQPCEKTLYNDEKIDANLFDLYNPIIKKMCEENPNIKQECRQLWNLARSARSGFNFPARGPARDILLQSGLLYSDGTLKPEAYALIAASFVMHPLNGQLKLESLTKDELLAVPCKLVYHNPLEQPDWSNPFQEPKDDKWSVEL